MSQKVLSTTSHKSFRMWCPSEDFYRCDVRKNLIKLFKKIFFDVMSHLVIRRDSPQITTDFHMWCPISCFFPMWCPKYVVVLMTSLASKITSRCDVRPFSSLHDVMSDPFPQFQMWCVTFCLFCVTFCLFWEVSGTSHLEVHEFIPNVMSQNQVFAMWCANLTALVCALARARAWTMARAAVSVHSTSLRGH